MTRTPSILLTVLLAAVSAACSSNPLAPSAPATASDAPAQPASYEATPTAPLETQVVLQQEAQPPTAPPPAAAQAPSAVVASAQTIAAPSAPAAAPVYPSGCVDHQRIDPPPHFIGPPVCAPQPPTK